MDISRRNLLKFLSIATGVFAVNPSALVLPRKDILSSNANNFFSDKKMEYGNSILYCQPFVNYRTFGIARILKEDANMALPEYIKYEFRIKIPTNFGRSLGMAWYSNFDIQKMPLETIKVPKNDNDKDGYYYFGRYITGA